jgi:2-polyprenyl-3-methyl-5-hydroxy-6-metoxy-1,4-benzoquinol methylase
MNDKEEAGTEEQITFQERIKENLIEHIEMNREIITHYAGELKGQGSTLHAINHRYLMKLIEAERVYEEELRELFPDL